MALDDATQTYDSVHDAVAARSEARAKAREEAGEVEETVEEETETETVEVDEEISEDDPSEDESEIDLEAGSDDVDEPEAEESEPETPAVAPPQYLGKEDKQAFEKLSPEAQELFLKVDRKREAFVTQKSQEISQQRQAFEQRLEGLGDFVSEREAAVAEYDKVDWVKAAQELSPQDYQQHRANHEALKAQLEQAKQAQSDAEVENHRTFVQDRAARLSDLANRNPIAATLTNSKDGVENQKKVFQYLHESGVDRDSLMWMPAEALVLGHKAMLYDRAQQRAHELPKKDSAAPRKPAPKTVRSTPSGRQGSSTTKELKRLEAKKDLSPSEFKRIQKLRRSQRK